MGKIFRGMLTYRFRVSIFTYMQLWLAQYRLGRLLLHVLCLIRRPFTIKYHLSRILAEYANTREATANRKGIKPKISEKV